MSSGERPIGAAKGQQPNTEALSQTHPFAIPHGGDRTLTKKHRTTMTPNSFGYIGTAAVLVLPLCGATSRPCPPPPRPHTHTPWGNRHDIGGGITKGGRGYMWGRLLTCAAILSWADTHDGLQLLTAVHYSGPLLQRSTPTVQGLVQRVRVGACTWCFSGLRAVLSRQSLQSFPSAIGYPYQPRGRSAVTRCLRRCQAPVAWTMECSRDTGHATQNVGWSLKCGCADSGRAGSPGGEAGGLGLLGEGEVLQTPTSEMPSRTPPWVRGCDLAA